MSKENGLTASAGQNIAQGYSAAEFRRGDWVRLPKPGETLLGMKRGTLYALCASGKIRWVTLKADPAARRGVRLLFKPSIAEYLEQLEREQRSQLPGSI